MNINLRAFLDTISMSEGTYGIGDNGYNVLVGGGLFNSYADHPRKSIYLPKLRIRSTAAGRYQELARNYDYYKIKLELKDFGPESQDRIAIRQLDECKALVRIYGDEFESAVHKCAHIWASFPGANYGQHENKMEKLHEFYIKVRNDHDCG